MKEKKKRPVPPPPPMVVDDDKIKKPGEDDAEPEMPPMQSPMVPLEDPIYLARHKTAQELQLRSAQEGYVLLKNSGILPLPTGTKLNVFGRSANLFFDPALCARCGLTVNTELYDFYAAYKTRDPGYTGSGYDEATGEYIPQNRTATGMFGMIGYLNHEPFIGYDVYNEDGTVRVAQLEQALLQRAQEFSDTAVVVLYRHGGEGADHEKGDERLSEGEAGMLSYCTAHFARVIVVLACNSVIDGDFLVQDQEYRFYTYTYGGGVYSNNIGNEVLADMDSRVVLKYTDSEGRPAPHVYPIRADRIGGVFYTCNKPGDNGAEALLQLLTGAVNPAGRLMDEIVYDYDDNPVSLCSGGLVFSRASTTEDLYIYGHNYVAYKEGVYLGYKYFETFCPDRVVYPFGFGLSYTGFSWEVGVLRTFPNSYGELQFSVDVAVTNTGDTAGREVVELYVTAPYYADGPYHLEKPFVQLAAFEKTGLLMPQQQQVVTLTWSARDIAAYSDVEQCYVLEHGDYRFRIAKDAGSSHRAPVQVLCWNAKEDVFFRADEVTGTPYRNLFTGSEEDGWRFDARGTALENIVYIHRVDLDGVPTVAEGTYPQPVVVDEHTRETTQVLDLKTRGLADYYEMDATAVHLYDSDIPAPLTNAVYYDADGQQRNFMLQDVYAYLNNAMDPRYHNTARLEAETGIHAEVWTAETDQAVWDHFLDQLSVNEMLCRFYHCGFDIPALPEYGIPQAFSADTPGQIGANNARPMGTTTSYCDSILACTFDKTLCETLGLALAREAAASGLNGTSYFYAPGNNLHRSCLSGKNNNYFSEDAYLSGRICGYFLKGLEQGGVNGCLKHFACNDQELSREGLVVFANEQTLRENYFAAFEHAIKIGGGQGIMTSLGRVGTVNACGNTHLTVDLLRKEWGFNGMVITDGYGVTSYMYEINDMIGASSGLLCFGNSGSFGENRDYMELYRYYHQYPGRTTAALRTFMQGCMHSLLQSHTFRDLYTGYDYYTSEDRDTTTDINWFETRIGLGYSFSMADRLTYLGIKLHEGESNPAGMMPNTNCKDRGGTIRLDDYGLTQVELSAAPGAVLRVPISVEKSYGIRRLGLAVLFDEKAFEFAGVSNEGSILTGYTTVTAPISGGIAITLETAGNLFTSPSGTLTTLELWVKPEATAGSYALTLLPLPDENGELNGCFIDKQGHEMSVGLSDRLTRQELGGGWSGAYQDVEHSGWQNRLPVMLNDDLADVTLLSGSVTVC